LLNIETNCALWIFSGYMHTRQASMDMDIGLATLNLWITDMDISTATPVCVQ